MLCRGHGWKTRPDHRGGLMTSHGRMYTDIDRFCLEIDGKGLYWMIPPDVSSLLRFSQRATIETDEGIVGSAALRYQASILCEIHQERYVINRQDILSLAAGLISTAPIRQIASFEGTICST